MSAPLPYFGLLLTSIVLAAGAQLLWKKGAEVSANAEAAAGVFFSPWVIGGFAIYGISAAIYVVALRKIPLAIAYPSIALGYVLVVLASWLWFGDTLGWLRVLALLMICCGVALLWVRA